MKFNKILNVMLLGAMCLGFMACEKEEPEVNNNQNTEQTDSNGNGTGGTKPTDPTTPMKETFTITLSVNDATMGTVSGAGEYEKDTEVTIEATANEGFEFVTWSDDVTDNPRTITVTADLSLTANFSKIGDKSRVENGHQAIDLGLTSGTLWATCNIGAEKPQDYGDYFCWGETVQKTGNSGWSDYAYSGTSWSSMTKYCCSADYGTVDNKQLLDPEDDAATANWGGDWRMPNWAEQDELKRECNWEWTALEGVNGYKVSSKAEGNNNFIFLPAAGYRSGSTMTLYKAGEYGNYWSNQVVAKESYQAYMFFFDVQYRTWDKAERFCSYSVRAICPQ